MVGRERVTDRTLSGSVTVREIAATVARPVLFGRGRGDTGDTPMRATKSEHDIHFGRLLAIVGTLAAFLVFVPLGVVLAVGFTAYALYARSTKAVMHPRLSEDRDTR